MLTNTTIILNGHFHDLLGLPVPPWIFLEIAVVVFFLRWMSIPFTSRQMTMSKQWKQIKGYQEAKLPQRQRGSAVITLFRVVQGHWFLYQSTSYSQRPTKAAGCKTLFLLHSQIYETYNLKFHVNFFLQFSPICRPWQVPPQPGAARTPVATPLRPCSPGSPPSVTTPWSLCRNLHLCLLPHKVCIVCRGCKRDVADRDR